MEARQIVRDEVKACTRGLVARKVRAVDAALFDDRQPSLREIARTHRLPSSTVHDLIGRVKARLQTRLTCPHSPRSNPR
jgi:hypothetical protein